MHLVRSERPQGACMLAYATWPSMQIVALQVSSTAVTGGVPATWGALSALDSLTLTATALDGPLPLTFKDSAAHRFVITDNTGAVFCGAGGTTPLLAALPVCSDAPGAVAVRPFPNHLACSMF